MDIRRVNEFVRADTLNENVTGDSQCCGFCDPMFDLGQYENRIPFTNTPNEFIIIVLIRENR